MTVLSGKPTFGAGRFFGIGAYTNPTPCRALVPQSQSIDFKRKTESLFGELQLPVAVGAGEMDVSNKIEYGKTQARIMADIMLGDSGVAGSYYEADNESGTVAATTPFTISVANAAHFLFDLGVQNAVTGAIYACVASGPVAGASYSVSAGGVYTFASGDAGIQMYISYAYSVPTVGESITMVNQLQGQIGQFTAVHVLPWGTEQDMFVFNYCIASSKGISAKKSGFGSQSLEYMAFAGGSGNGSLGTATFSEAA
jgi:hypothetical protein